LVFSAKAFWWLKHYEDFQRHLESCYRVVAREDACLIYALQELEGPISGAER
jgi:hypothetical protein